MRIAIVGGTGKEGRALALRWARAGEDVIVGSRMVERAGETADTINAAAGRVAATGLTNREAAAAGDVVILTVPYDSQADILREIRDGVQGKVVVTAVVPIDGKQPRRLRDVPGDSATEEAQALLGPGVRVVAAFQNVSHTKLAGNGAGCDVLICGDDPDARRTVAALVERLGFRPVDAGPARNARVVEGLTVLLLHINREYKSTGAGIRVTGLSETDRH
ncbi:MAG TPA: NADPH-dependent F420 reductase [Candidatus Baltobacteraceae bacterium]|nr:NADPH-dependent F420 reductase [Candidatus Baltobacteraceae bacterium]